MADPISTIMLTVDAVKAAVKVAEWWDSRHSRSSGSQQMTSSTETGTFYRQTIPDIFLVHATLGQRLLALNVINHAALPEAHKAVRESFSIGDEEDELRDEFDDADEVVQYTIVCSMVFCAECWPMHIWQGFGCGVLNNTMWAYMQNCNTTCKKVDLSIAALKSKLHGWQLFTKSPMRIGQSYPIFGEIDKEWRKQTLGIMADFVGQLEKHGFPQPLPPNDHIRVSSWTLPFATWGGSMYGDLGHCYEPLCNYQCDPGRLLYSWTVGRRAELRPGEALVLVNEITWALAEWLEGLQGMTFKVLKDTEVDFSKMKFKNSTKKIFNKITGNDYGIAGEPFIMVGLPRLADSLPSQLEQLQLSAIPPVKASPVMAHGIAAVSQPDAYPPPYSPNQMSPISMSSQSGPVSPTRRRPLPVPPVTAIRTATATHVFIPMTDEELGFNAGDTIEILDDSAEDGWWKGRIGERTGLIPRTFIK
jgi:hypothetical protein